MDKRGVWKKVLREAFVRGDGIVGIQAETPTGVARTLLYIDSQGLSMDHSRHSTYMLLT